MLEKDHTRVNTEANTHFWLMNEAERGATDFLHTGV